jgi:shikimate kinase
MEKNIVLIGFMGTGKSTIGMKLAEKLKMQFIDMDRVIGYL